MSSLYKFSRFSAFAGVVALTALFCLLAAVADRHFLWPLAVLVPLSLLGVWNLVQPGHSLLRNYPLLAHFRWLFEMIRPEIRQYLLESDQDAAPFNRNQRSLVYQRAKGALDNLPFGTERDVDAAGYTWIAHSIRPAPVSEELHRLEIGGEGCAKPYSSSLLNISAMSFGSLSAHAILALNKGAKLGGFAHDTGEGSISRYHRESGGDLIWEIGSGYFGCRHDDGRFNLEMFAEQAQSEQVKMVELKLSQGAKPGHGGILPAAKITPEIAEARHIPMGRDCVSPGHHGCFETPIELMKFIETMREASGGKPAGFKLCVGHRWEFMAICKAMLETGILPDFIVVDGAEGGTGAAPLEFSDHIGMPLKDGLTFVHNVLLGTGLRRKLRLGASGKVISAFDIAHAIALGADWCNSARGFMFALGCVQSRSCHTNRCPTGVATQDALRGRALVVEDKAERVRNFHRNTLEALAEVTAAAGLEHPREFRPRHFRHRLRTGQVTSSEEAYVRLVDGELLSGTDKPGYMDEWRRARTDSFEPSIA